MLKEFILAVNAEAPAAESPTVANEDNACLPAVSPFVRESIEGAPVRLGSPFKLGTPGSPTDFNASAGLANTPASFAPAPVNALPVSKPVTALVPAVEVLILFNAELDMFFVIELRPPKVSEMPEVEPVVELITEETADCPPGKLDNPLAIADGFNPATPAIPGTLFIAPVNAFIPEPTPLLATIESTLGILPEIASTPAPFNPCFNASALGKPGSFVSAAACSNLFARLIDVKFCGIPAFKDLSEPDIAENADPDKPFVASNNPVALDKSGGFIFFNASRLGSPGGIFGNPLVKLVRLGNPLVKLVKLGTPGNAGNFGKDIPVKEVAIELAPPVVVANADAKLPPPIELATLAKLGKVAIIMSLQHR